MAFDFPSPATSGQRVSGPNSAWWQYDGVKWLASTANPGASAIISDVAPTNQPVGTIWFDSLGLQSYINYQDPNSLEWVPLVNQSGLGIAPMAVVPDTSISPWIGPTLTGYTTPAGDPRGNYAQFAARRYTAPVGSGHNNWDGGSLCVYGPNFSTDGVTTNTTYANGVGIGTGSNMTASRYGWLFGPDGNTTMPGNITASGNVSANGSVNAGTNLSAANNVYAHTSVDYGFYLGYSGDRYLNFTTDGWKLLWQNGSGDLIYINNGGGWLWYCDGSGNGWNAGNYSAGGAVGAGTSVTSNNGRIMSLTGANVMPSLAMWSQQNGYCAGLAMGGAGDTNMYFCQMDGSGNYTNQFGYIDSSSNLTIHGQIAAGGNVVINGGLGLLFTGVYNSGVWYAFGWDGSCLNYAINGGGQGQLYTVGQNDGRYVQNGQNVSFAAIDCNYIHCNNGYGIQFSTACPYGTGTDWCLGWSNVWGSAITFCLSGGALLVGVQSNVSDERMKFDVAPSTFDCLDTVRQFPLFQFKWRDASDLTSRKAARELEDAPVQRVGLIAQRIHEVFPEGVMEGDGDDTEQFGKVWGLNAAAMFSLLVGAVQQLSAEVADLRGRHGG